MVTMAERETRPEPPGGETREQFAKALLKSAMRGPWEVPLNTREEVATGRALHPRLVDLLEVAAWIRAANLSRSEAMILLYHFGWADETIQEVANRLNMHRATVYRLRHQLVQSFLRRYYDEPDYEMPHRGYTRLEGANRYGQT